MEVICYACGKGEFPENTLEAIVHCQHINPNWRIEIDLQLTSDGEVVLFHDDNLLRITNVDKNISEVGYAELKNMDAAHNFKEELGFPLRGANLKIPLLKTVFRQFPNANYVLDVHSNKLEIVDKIVRVVEDSFMERKIVLVSKHHRILEKFKTKRPYWKYGASSKQVKWLLMAKFLGFVKWHNINATIVMMPIIYQNRKILSNRLAQLIKRKHKKLWVWLHEGKQVITIDSMAQLERIQNYDIDAFFTSCPEKLHNELVPVP